MASNQYYTNDNLIFVLLVYALPYTIAQFETGSSPNTTRPNNEFSIGPRFNPSMAIIMVVLVSAFFVLGFFSVYARQCFANRLGRPGLDLSNFVGGNGRRSRAVRGLDPNVIETFPTFSYSAVKGLKIGTNVLECAVCLNEFEEDETLRLIPNCSHVFHPLCIDTWLNSHVTCPVCRSNLVPEPADSDSLLVDVFEPTVDTRLDETRNEVLTTNVTRLPELIQNHPPRSKSTGWRLPRSHSTGHSLVQLGGDLERFTLRLPDDVRNQLMDSTFNRSKSCVVFQRELSSKKGYRSTSSGGSKGKANFEYERFGRDGRANRLVLTATQQFFSRTRSIQSYGDGSKDTTPPARSNVFKFGKSQNDDNTGERSSDKLRPDSKV